MTYAPDEPQFFNYGETRRPPIWAPCRNQDGVGSGISRYINGVDLSKCNLIGCDTFISPKFYIFRTLNMTNFTLSNHPTSTPKDLNSLHLTSIKFRTLIFANAGDNMRNLIRMNQWFKQSPCKCVNALIKTDYMICLFPNWTRLSIWPSFWYK